jgi:hypothetical protein
MKYPMSEKTDRPLFDYIVVLNGEEDYYLYDDFDLALKKAMEIAVNYKTSLIYEIVFNNETREYRGQNTFTISGGKVHYDKHEKAGLHIQFYINAGEWLNPNEEWLTILNNKKDSPTD